jgi:NAD(P)-dependent dehydrogenase (short-subunit alcohol dehydrogenase family)
MPNNILIAGAGKGIGFELVKHLMTNENCEILAISRNTKQLEELVENQKPKTSRIIPLSLDLSSHDFTDRLQDCQNKNKFLPNIVIYNAGLLINKPFSALSGSDFDRMFEVNIKGAFRLFQALIPDLPEGSHLLGISSMGGYQGSAKFPGLSIYSASKAALAVMMECLAEELKERKISANALALGAAQTAMLEEAFPGYSAPLSAAEMASFIADFAINGGRYFNGKILPVSLSTP